MLSIADTVTYIGRCSIKKSAKMAKEKYDCEIVYGDSVSMDTPVVIRENNEISIRPISELSNTYYKLNGKEYSNGLGLEVWSDIGWTRIKSIMRHKTTKKMYRVMTKTGIVDITSDHSLIDSKGNILKPDKALGISLMSKHLIDLT